MLLGHKDYPLNISSIGSHKELLDRYEEAIAVAAVLKNALKRMVKYQMSGKKCLETAAEALKEVGA